MMPDLGKYAVEVLSAYGASLTLLCVLIGMSLRRGKMARATLQAAEKEAKSDG
ncbi:MAG: heme exporter protein CcmD [Sulfitobacter sp.]